MLLGQEYKKYNSIFKFRLYKNICITFMEESMSKLLYKRIIIIFMTMLIFMLMSIIIKQINGNKIAHFKQFLFPCKGQIAFVPNDEVHVQFELIDESEISELSNKNNILEIEMISENGDILKADDWNISNKEIFNSKYTSKIVDIVINNLNNEFAIKSLRLVYPDVNETFEVGELNLRLIQNDEITPYVNINYNFLQKTLDGLFTGQEEVRPTEITCGQFDINGLKEGLLITKIDLGIDGLFLDGVNVIEIGEILNMDQAFMEKNKEYFSVSRVDKLPVQNINISIGEKTEYKLISVVTTKEFDNNLVNLYFAPIFYIKDKSNNKESIFIKRNSYIIQSPMIFSDSFIERLFEEGGV